RLPGAIRRPRGPPPSRRSASRARSGLRLGADVEVRAVEAGDGRAGEVVREGAGRRLALVVVLGEAEVEVREGRDLKGRPRRADHGARRVLRLVVDGHVHREVAHVGRVAADGAEVAGDALLVLVGDGDRRGPAAGRRTAAAGGQGAGGEGDGETAVESTVHPSALLRPVVHRPRLRHPTHSWSQKGPPGATKAFPREGPGGRLAGGPR